MTAWSLEQAQTHLLGLELFGMSLGLERMHKLLGELSSPQAGLRAVHVVGTNGKSSTTRMTAGILEAHDFKTGAFLSPHLKSFTERIRIGGGDITSSAFASAVQAAAEAAARVDAESPSGDRVTQFELLTAAGLLSFSRAGVDVAVVEAGLGGRLDATNVLGAPVVALTSVGLEHTRWLGTTEAAIAAEKLAVLTPQATLVTGPLPPAARDVARETAATRGARLVEVAEAGPSMAVCAAPAAEVLAGVGEDPSAFLSGSAPAVGQTLLLGYQETNWAVAVAAAESLVGSLDARKVHLAKQNVQVPGRLHVLGLDPLTIADGAHNPDGIRALVASLGSMALAQAGPRYAVVSILDDKDAAEMLSVLRAQCDGVYLTQVANPRALSAEALRQLASAGRAELFAEPDPQRALAAARASAGYQGTVVATGSIYLVRELLDTVGERVPSTL